MPPNSTQNLNAKLSLVSVEPTHPRGTGLSLAPPPIQSSAPPIQILGGAASYHGGYHLSGV